MLAYLLLMACTTEPGPDVAPVVEPSTSTPEPTTMTEPPPPPDDCEDPDPGAVSVKVIRHSSSVHQVTAEVAVGVPASIAVVCENRADATDQLLWESTAGFQTHTLGLTGLQAASTYDCLAAPTCPVTVQAPTAFSFETGPLPRGIPNSQVIRHPTLEPDPATPHFVVNHQRYCQSTQSHRILAYDIDGVLRWSWDAFPPGTPIALNAQYVGGGQFVWGGGWTFDGAPEIIGIDHTLQYKMQFEGSESLLFHHEGRMIDDGSLLSISRTSNTIDDLPFWEGFGVWVVDPATSKVTWSWDSQEAVNEGILGIGAPKEDVYHANAADIVDSDFGRLMVASLCFVSQVIAVDVGTGEVQWLFGPGGDFALVDLKGNPLPDTEFPDCQHGVELIGDRLLAYDNGRYHRKYSRASEYRLDPAKGVAVQTWTWTEPNWWEATLGDIDELSADRVLITQAHPECWSGVWNDRSDSVEVDRPSGEVVWRHRMGSRQDATYRSERFNGCDAFPQVGLCPEVAARLAELGVQ